MRRILVVFVGISLFSMTGCSANSVQGDYVSISDNLPTEFTIDFDPESCQNRGFGFGGSDYRWAAEIQNVSSQAILAIEGIMTVKDAFKRKIESNSFQSFKRIETNSKIVYSEDEQTLSCSTRAVRDLTWESISLLKMSVKITAISFEGGKVINFK